MKRLALLATSCLAALGLLAADAIAVPDTVTFTGRVSDGNGPIDGTVNLGFQIYSAPTAGTLMWEETYAGVSASAGLVYVNLGSQDPLDPTVFTGADLYLQLIVNGTNQSPRVPINSVPYATTAGTAATLGTLTPSDVALSTHNHDASYATAGHNHDGSYSLTSHNHDGSYATAAHNHAGVYAPLSHSHGSADIDAYQDLSDSSRFGADAATDVLLRSDGDTRYSLSTHNHDAVYINDITTAAGSGLDGGCTSGTCTMSADPTDFNAVPANQHDAVQLDILDSTYVTLVQESITVPVAGTVVAIAGLDPFPINLTAGQSAFLYTILTTSPTGTTGNSTSTRWNYESVGFDYKHVSNMAVFSVAAGTTTVYYRGSQGNQGDIRTFNRRLTVFFIPG